MKRNLLIGTSLVAAFATTSLSARAASAIDKASYDLTTDVAVAHRVAEKALASATVTGATPLKAGATPVTLLEATLGSDAGREAVAKILKATTLEAKTSDALVAAFGKQTEAQKNAAVAEIAKALATNVELRKLVDAYRPAVVAAEQSKAPKPGPTPEPVVVVETEATIEALTQAVVNTTDALTTAIIAEGVAQKTVADTTADETAAQKVKADADTALTAEQTAATDAATKATAAKEAADKATAALTALTTEKKAKEEAIVASEKAIADKAAADTAATAAETDALNVLKAELGTIDAKIAAATTAQTDTAAALVAADKAVADAKAVVETTTKAQAEAVKAFDAATKAKADAATALTAKTTAVTETTTKLATAKDALLAAATTAATTAATKATAATEAAGAAELKKTELATAAESAKAKVVELGKRETSLKAELTVAITTDAAASTDATKATVQAKEAAVIAIATELAGAKIAATHAAQIAQTALHAAAKATADAATATEAKTKADEALTAAKDAVKAADDAVKAAKATVAQTAEKAKADALAAKTKADVKKADAAEAKAAEELAALEAKLTLDPTNKDLQDAVAAKKAELAGLTAATTKATEAAATAAKAADKAASDLAAKEAELATAALSAKALTDQLTAAQTAAAEAAARVAALEDAGSKSAIEVSGLTADKIALTATVDGFNADLVVDSLIKRTEGELESAQTAAGAADNTFETLMAEITVLVKKDDAAAATVSLAEALKDASIAQIRSDVVRMRDTQTAASEGYAKALAAANTLTDETAKAAAIAKLGDAPAVDARLEQLIAAIDAYVAADLDVKAAHSFLDTASRLRDLMQQATVEGAGEGTLSEKLAARFNANVVVHKAHLVALLNRTGRPVGVVAEAIRAFEELAREVRQFNELKTLFDIDAKLNAKDDAVTAQLKRIVAELQATVDSSVTVDAVAKVEKLVVAMQQSLATASRGLERFARVEGSKSYDDAPRRAALIVDAAAHLETLQRALRDASDVATGTIEGLMSQLAQAKELSDEFAELTQRETAEKARFAGLTDADKADKRVEKEHKDELSDLEARKGRLVDDAADLERKDDGHGRVENLTTDAVAQLQRALFEYTAFLEKLENTSDFDLVDADTIDRVFSTKTDGAGSSKAGFDAFKARVGQAVPFASKDIDTVSRQFAASVERKERELATQSRVLGEKLDAAVHAFETEYRAVAAAAPIALDAFEFLQREVLDRQSDIVRLTAHNAELATAKAQAADAADQVRIQGQIDRNAREIAEFTTWFADNAANIAAATAEAGKLATLDAEVTALRAQSTALRADFAKTSEERAADTRALEELTRAVRQARAVKVEENGAFVADLEAAVATILSPTPVADVVESEEDEEGVEEDVEEDEEGAESGSDGAANGNSTAAGETTGTGGAQSASAPLPTGGEFGGGTTTMPLPTRGTPSTVGFDAPGAATSATDGTTTTTAGGGHASPERTNALRLEAEARARTAAAQTMDLDE